MDMSQDIFIALFSSWNSYYRWARIQRYLARYTIRQFNKITVQREYTIAWNDLHREIEQNLQQVSNSL